MPTVLSRHHLRRPLRQVGHTSLASEQEEKPDKTEQEKGKTKYDMCRYITAWRCIPQLLLRTCSSQGGAGRQSRPRRAIL